LEISGGFGLGFDTEKVGGTRSSEFYLSLGPRVMYFVVDGLAVGGDFILSVGWSKTGEDSSTNVAFGMLPAIEYNFDLGGRVFPYAGLTTGYLLGWWKSEGTSATTNQFDVIFEGGIKIAFHQALLGVGLSLPIAVNMPEGGGNYVNVGVQVMTRYGIYF